MQITAATLAGIINAELEGDTEVIITAPAKIEEATPGTITFLGNPDYEPYVYNTEASAILVAKDFTPKRALPAGLTLLRVDNVYQSVSQLLEAYQQSPADEEGGKVADGARVHPSAELGASVTVGELSVIGQGAIVGAGTFIDAQVTVGPGVRIGENCVIHAGARILRNCVVGNECVINANAVIGGDGFGHAPDPETGAYRKIPQIGNVVLHDRVEVGAGTTIDRATMGSTVIHEGVKMDNLIQVAHNVEIGAHTVVAAQVGISGSTKIGKHCMIGGQAGIVGHNKMGDGAIVHPKTGVMSDLKPGDRVIGAPHLPFRDYMRSYSIFRKLPALIRDLERRIKGLETQ